jgi:RNA polymerase sigma-70 factor (ECF subfamily)
MDFDDQNIIQQIRKSDRKVFESLFRTYYPRLCIFGLRFFDNPQITEDIAQDLFVVLWEKRKQLEIKTSLHSFIFQAYRNRCLDYIKHQKVIQKYIDEKINDPDEKQLNDYLEIEEKKFKIHKAIESLPPKCKKVFMMSRFEGLKQQVIADQLGISVKTIKAQIGKALKIIRKELGKE